MYIGFYRDAERFTAGCRPAIDAVAAALALSFHPGLGAVRRA